MKTFLVVNPKSANGRTGARWPEISAHVSRALGEFRHAFTEAPMDAARIARQAIREGYLWHEFGDSHLVLGRRLQS